jgi:hypothetical protein
MKKLALCLILLLAIMIPLACGNQNNSPNGPIGGGGATATFTSSPTKTNTPGGPTSTPTPLPAGANTPTFTPTFSVPIPVYEHTYGTASSPNGMVISANAASVTVMTLAEYQLGGVEGVEYFYLGAGGVTTNIAGNFPGESGAILQGIPTPALTPPWEPTTVTLNGPQGFAYPNIGFGSAYATILDLQSGGGALLYEGNANMAGWNNPYNFGFLYEPQTTNGYGGTPFKNPKGLTADLIGDIYVADTGNGQVDEFNGQTPAGANGGTNNGIYQLHFIKGNGGITFINNTAPANPTTFVSVPFISPYAVAVDPSNNLWVGDTGYSPSVVEAYSTQGGVSILAAWPTVSGCVVHGITVSPIVPNNVYVSDSGNNQIEIYNQLGTLLGVITDPHSSYEGGAFFAPSCVGCNNATGDLWVADTSNDNIISFH